MVSYNRIIEARFHSKHFLTRKVFGDVTFSKYSTAFSQIVYFDEIDPKVITAKLVYIQQNENEPEGFFNLIEEDLTFDECLIVSTLYFVQSIPTIKRLLNHPLQPIEDLLQHILKPTNGYLLYSIQFEQLAQLILNVPLSESVRLRRIYNKQPSVFNGVEFDSNDFSIFKSIIQRHCILKKVYSPNYQGAKNLLLYARSIA